jgi:hypothetical protein
MRTNHPERASGLWLRPVVLIRFYPHEKLLLEIQEIESQVPWALNYLDENH